MPAADQLLRPDHPSAYAHAEYADAKRALHRLLTERRMLNESAARSLEEGLEETLTLRRLGLFPQLGTSFKTTNRIESVTARGEAKTERVDRWRTSDQKLRWCAAALLAAEKQFRCVKGYGHLPLLERALTTKATGDYRCRWRRKKRHVDARTRRGCEYDDSDGIRAAALDLYGNRQPGT